MERHYDSGNWPVSAFFGLLILLVADRAVCQGPGLSAGSPSSRVVLVSIPDRKLVVVQNDEVIASFPVAVGAAASPSPTGEFEIATRVTNPTYYHPGTVIPAGKHNPLGSRWIGLNKKGYGIHGTNVPTSVGRAASHGCIRLRNRDIEQLFSMVRVGDRVEIHGERDDQIARWLGSKSQEGIATTSALETAGQ